MRSTIASMVCCALAGVTLAGNSQAAMKLPTNIAPQALGSALQELANERKFQLVYIYDELQAKRSGGAVGDLSTPDALQLLLEGTGLTYKYLDDETITIVPLGARTSIATQSSSSSNAKPYSTDALSRSLRLAQQSLSDGARIENNSSSGKKDTDQPIQLEQILVTAQKKQERLQDVPVPVSVLDTDILAASGQVLLRDYVSSVPGLMLEPAVEGFQSLSVRGITTGSFTNPTVGVVIDDVPFGGSAGSGGNQVPDLDPGELTRIEVLRGPQGTLYGADSMGGLVKFVTPDPSVQEYSGRIEAGTSGVENGSGLGYVMRASGNAPVGDTFAIRASAFARQDPGYIDNSAFNIGGVNQAEAYGGRISTLWLPSDTVSLKITALYQRYKSDGGSEVVPSAGDLTQNDLFIPGWGGTDRLVQAYSATLKAKLGSFDLTALTGYNSNHISDSWQSTLYYGPSAQQHFQVSGAPLADYNDTDKLSQEIRLVAPLGAKAEWLIGGFYTHEYTRRQQYLYAAIPDTGQVVGQLDYYNAAQRFEDYAAFTDLTYHFTDSFDLQIGGRETHTVTRIPESIFTGLIYNPPSITPAEQASANSFTYLLTPRLRVSPNLMVYARLASGFRPGIPNNEVAIQAGAPAASSPDKTENFELGAKGSLPDQMLSFDASVFYIKWKDIQISRVVGVDGYTGNGSEAKSQGVELSADWKPVRALSIDAWVDFTDAALTKALPPGPSYGQPGDRLPYSSRFSGNMAFTQNFPVSNGVTSFLGGVVSYVGDRVGEFTDSASRTELGGYAKADLHAGFSYDSWTVNVFVDNVANRRGLLSGGEGYFPPTAFTYIQPRMIGANFVKNF